MGLYDLHKGLPPHRENGFGEIHPTKLRVVKGKSPKTYQYSRTPTYTYYDSYPLPLSSARNASMVGGEAGKRGSGDIDRFARFEGADYIEVPGDAFMDVKNEITVSFWLKGDPLHQPMASTIFEGLDRDGKRVINLHVPYDNGVVYWDAGGHGEGLTDNIYKPANPKDYKGRWTHYFNDIASLPVINSSVIPTGKSVGWQGKCFGSPSFIANSGLPFSSVKPVQGVAPVIDSIPNPIVNIVIYGDSLQPQIPTDTLNVYPGYHYYCNSQGIVIDSTAADSTIELKRKTRTWYGKPFEVIEQFEIGRFITPYGKRLDLGLNGFTWVYDVTEYEPLLHGKVDLQAANGQELLDLKFIFIEGIPPRDVISVRNIWTEGSYIYKDLADDKVLATVNCKLQTGAASFMLRARISGHGHNGPFNCCEWDPKMHTFSINGEKKFDWKVWRDCGMNPVHPQGGTWQFDRAGWCPGTRQEYRRMNPLSLNPVIRVRNRGTDTISRFTVIYGITGTREEKYEWNGKLGFMQYADIILPKPSWKGLSDDSHFRATIETVNGRKDDLVTNNSLISSVTTPVILPEAFYIHVKTQAFGRAADNAYKIINDKGEVVFERMVFEDDSVYHDLTPLKPGAPASNKKNLISAAYQYFQYNPANHPQRIRYSG